MNVHGTDDDCVMCGGMGWRPTIGDGNNWCPCIYYETHPRNKQPEEMQR